MYTGTLAPVSNRASWSESLQLFDADTNTPFDLSTAIEIALQVRDLECGSALLSATLTGGGITRQATTGVVSWSFPPSQLSALCQRTYAVGITITAPDGSVEQVLVGELPVIEGIVR